MKSPLSDIFSLAPLVCQNRVLYIRGGSNTKNIRIICCIKTWLISIIFLPPRPTTNPICSSATPMVTELVISSCKTSEGFYQSQSIYSANICVWLLKNISNRLNFIKTQQIFSKAAQMLWGNLQTRKGKANLNWKGLFHFMNMKEDQLAKNNHKRTSITEKICSSIPKF